MIKRRNPIRTHLLTEVKNQVWKNEISEELWDLVMADVAGPVYDITSILSTRIAFEIDYPFSI